MEFLLHNIVGQAQANHPISQKPELSTRVKHGLEWVHQDESQEADGLCRSDRRLGFQIYSNWSGANLELVNPFPQGEKGDPYKYKNSKTGGNFL